MCEVVTDVPKLIRARALARASASLETTHVYNAECARTEIDTTMVGWGSSTQSPLRLLVKVNQAISSILYCTGEL